MSRRDRSRSLPRVALAAVCAVALLQIALGLAGLAVAAFGAEWTRPTAVRDWQRAVQVLAFSALSAHLVLGGRGDVRARNLGALLLLIALFYAHPPIQVLANAVAPPWSSAVLVFRAFTVDAFTPALAWLFVRDFPRALEWPRVAAFVRTMMGASLFAAAGLIAANVAIALRGDTAALAPFARSDPYGYYWTIIFGLLSPVLPFVLWRTRHAPLDERRRVRLFATGIAVAGILPVGVAALPPLFPALEHLVRQSAFLVPFTLLMTFSVAAITTYSVVVERVLDVRTVLRKAAQYWLAVGIVAAVAVAPFVLLARLLYLGRDEPLGALLLGHRGLPILAMAAAGAVLLRVRQPVMLAIDRIFFREAFDPQQILSALAAQARGGASTERFACSLLELLDQAIHPETIGMLVVGAKNADVLVPVSSALRSLPASSRLAAVLRAHAAPLAVDLARLAPALRETSDEDRVWLGDAGVAMLVPLLGSAGDLQGILALGPKRSELPYSRVDEVLLRAVAGATGIALENRRLRDSGAAERAAMVDSRASECVACGWIGEAGVAHCGECSSQVRDAALPPEPFGKFALERRIGAGAMGVVYAARDIALARRVALKTLPRTNPADAERLRREARAMAAVTHPNLALILGAETWQGTPILVLEYLAKGTLETRIQAGPMPARRALEVALAITRVLERLHASGLLHRDVKPSNIGFSEADDPKLLDFGLVQILRDVVPASALAGATPLDETGFAGTPLYMAPEALDAGRPDPGFDLGGLAVSTFEAMSGQHPFARGSSRATLAAIRAGWQESLRDLLPAEAEPAADFFAIALAPQRSQRPGTAAEFAERIHKILHAYA